MTNIIITTAVVSLTLTVPTGAAVQIFTSGQSQTTVAQTIQTAAVSPQPLEQIHVIVEMPSIAPSALPTTSPSPTITPSPSPSPSVSPASNQFIPPSPLSMINQAQIPQPRQMIPVSNNATASPAPTTI